VKKTLNWLCDFASLHAGQMHELISKTGFFRPLLTLGAVSIRNLQMGDACTASMVAFDPASGPFVPQRYPPVAYLNAPLNHLPFDQKLMLVARGCNITMAKTGQPVCPSWALHEHGGNWEEG